MDFVDSQVLPEKYQIFIDANPPFAFCQSLSPNTRHLHSAQAEVQTFLLSFRHFITIIVFVRRALFIFTAE